MYWRGKLQSVLLRKLSSEKKKKLLNNSFISFYKNILHIYIMQKIILGGCTTKYQQELYLSDINIGGVFLPILVCFLNLSTTNMEILHNRYIWKLIIKEQQPFYPPQSKDNSSWKRRAKPNGNRNALLSPTIY